MLKSRRLQNGINSVRDDNGRWVDSTEEVRRAFLTYYIELLGTRITHRRRINRDIIKLGPMVTEIHTQILMECYFVHEVKNELFYIPEMKAPGPDGYGSSFYQDNCDLVGKDVEQAVLSFLNSRKMLKEVNATTITLIP